MRVCVLLAGPWHKVVCLFSPCMLALLHVLFLTDMTFRLHVNVRTHVQCCTCRGSVYSGVMLYRLCALLWMLV